MGDANGKPIRLSPRDPDNSLTGAKKHESEGLSKEADAKKEADDAATDIREAERLEREAAAADQIGNDDGAANLRRQAETRRKAAETKRDQEKTDKEDAKSEFAKAARDYPTAISWLGAAVDNDEDKVDASKAKPHETRERALQRAILAHIARAEAKEAMARAITKANPDGLTPEQAKQVADAKQGSKDDYKAAADHAAEVGDINKSDKTTSDDGPEAAYWYGKEAVFRALAGDSKGAADARKKVQDVQARR